MTVLAREVAARERNEKIKEEYLKHKPGIQVRSNGYAAELLRVKVAPLKPSHGNEFCDTKE